MARKSRRAYREILLFVLLDLCLKKATETGWRGDTRSRNSQVKFFGDAQHKFFMRHDGLAVTTIGYSASVTLLPNITFHVIN